MQNHEEDKASLGCKQRTPSASLTSFQDSFGGSKGDVVDTSAKSSPVEPNPSVNEAQRPLDPQPLDVGTNPTIRINPNSPEDPETTPFALSERQDSLHLTAQTKSTTSPSTKEEIFPAGSSPDILSDGKTHLGRPVACLACREKKHKCDKLMPSCTRCLTSNDICGYKAGKRLRVDRSENESRTSKRQCGLAQPSYTGCFKADIKCEYSIQPDNFNGSSTSQCPSSAEVSEDFQRIIVDSEQEVPFDWKAEMCSSGLNNIQYTQTTAALLPTPRDERTWHPLPYKRAGGNFNSTWGISLRGDTYKCSQKKVTASEGPSCFIS